MTEEPTVPPGQLATPRRTLAIGDCRLAIADSRMGDWRLETDGLKTDGLKTGACRKLAIRQSSIVNRQSVNLHSPIGSLKSEHVARKSRTSACERGDCRPVRSASSMGPSSWDSSQNIAPARFCAAMYSPLSRTDPGSS